ncbi:MAG: immunoglobulin domain-containing protein [Verrucomicrobia bacterium]|nr:immunoglobulin domain-containing protein [Verrucomicrobiota bacterium]
MNRGFIHSFAALALFLALVCVQAAFVSASLAAPGEAEESFNLAANGVVYSTAIQADNKLLLGGGFTSLAGQARNYLARLNANGSLDTAFNPGADGIVFSTAVQVDRKIVIGGIFNTVGGAPRSRLARLNEDGSLDTGFNPNLEGAIYNTTLQPDGKLIIGGTFNTVGGTARYHLARLNPNGSVDTAFNPDINNGVLTMAVQADGKIVIGGFFTTVGGTPRNCLARLNADGSPDGSFNPNPDGTVCSILMQPDGRMIIGGGFGTVGGAAHRNLVRLNADGTLDTTFGGQPDNFVFSTAAQADGKLIIGGSFKAVDGTPRNRLARLNADGTLDAGFNPSADGLVFSTMLQMDGKVIVGGRFGAVGGASRSYIARLGNDAATESLTVPSSIAVQWRRSGASPEPQAVTFESSTDGGMNWAFLGSSTRATNGWEVTGLNLPITGKVRARARFPGGQFNGSGGMAETILTYLNSRPTIAVQPQSQAGLAGANVTFTVTVNGTAPLAYQWRMTGSGDIIGATNGSFTLFNVTTNDAAGYSLIIRNSYGSVTSVVAVLTVKDPPVITVQPQGQIVPVGSNVVFGITASGDAPLFYQWRKNGGNILNATNFTYILTNVTAANSGNYTVVVTNAYGSATSVAAALSVIKPGETDLTFNPNLSNGSQIHSLALQKDGKIIIGSAPFPRRNPDGTQDATFSVTGVTWVESVAEQTDGKIVIGGQFTTINGVARNRIARLNPDGSLDADFAPSVGGSIVYCATLQTDGKIIVAGAFSNVNGVVKKNLARLNADGTLDASFDPKPNNFNVYSVAVQADRKILIGGDFTSVDGGATLDSYRIARLNEDGTKDTSFNAGADSFVRCIVPQSDGKMIVGGHFTIISGFGGNKIARLNNDGSLDASFSANINATILPNYSVATIVFQVDGRIFIGGSFTNVNGIARKSLARLNANGTLDTSFTSDIDDPTSPPTISAGAVSTMAIQLDGNLLVGGSFTRVDGVTWNHLVRLRNTPATQALTITNTSRVQWLRGGTSQEILEATFDLSNESGTSWTRIGTGTRITGGWEMTGLNLPVAGQIRARGWLWDGAGSSSLIESVTPYLLVTPSAPIITTPPQSQAKMAGTPVTLSVTATTGYPFFSYQWRRNGTNLVSATNSTLVFTNVQVVDAGSYDVVVSNSLGSATSSPPAVLTVLSIPVIVTPPLSKVIIASNPVTLSVTVLGSPTPQYQWRKGGINIPGANGPVFTISNAQPADAGSYVVVATNIYGSVTSSPPAVLTVLMPPSITTAPTGQAALVGTVARFTVVAAGIPPPSYQWRRNGTNLGGVTSTTLTISNVQPVNAGSYEVVVTNAVGSVTSAPPAMLTVVGQPNITVAPTNLMVVAGNTAMFSVTAAGGALNYKWLFRSNALADATNDTLVLASVARTNSGYYSVTVTNLAGSVTSSNALLRVLAPQRILPLTALGGDRYQISFADFDGGPLFDWDLNSLEVQGSTNTSSTNWVTLTNALVISNGVGQVEFLVTNAPPQQFYRIRMR